MSEITEMRTGRVTNPSWPALHLPRYWAVQPLQATHPHGRLNSASAKVVEIEGTFGLTQMQFQHHDIEDIW